jgi:hypothetical protein
MPKDLRKIAPTDFTLARVDGRLLNGAAPKHWTVAAKGPYQRLPASLLSR